MTATGTPTPLAQSGAPITVLTQTADYPHALEIQEPLRLVPGVQITASGQTGAQALDLPARRRFELHQGPGRWRARQRHRLACRSLDPREHRHRSRRGPAPAQLPCSTARMHFQASSPSRPPAAPPRCRSSPMPSMAATSASFGRKARLPEHTPASTTTVACRSFQTANNQSNDQFHNSTSYGNFGYAPDSRTDVRFTFHHDRHQQRQPERHLALRPP